MKRKTIFYLAFFTGLVLIFFLVLVKLVPGFAKSRLPPLGYVKPFAFTDQDGKTVTEKDIAGKVVVSEYFFTTCRGICPKLNNNMKKVYEEFKNEPGFLILSHTCDPETDTPERLKKYSDSMGVSNKNWIFLTGRKDSLYNMARLSYKIDDPANNLTDIKDDFLHSQFFALVDKKGDVTKIYDGLKQVQVKQLMEDIQVLLKE